MSIKEFHSNILDESYYMINHSSGLTIYVYPKSEYTSAYAVFGTKFGSVNNAFTTKDGNLVTVPDGIAHYLEHKLFESEDGDAFERFSKTGANANAYTAFDKTCYLFSCSDKFEENLEILLDFVQTPYFTKETVQKEQGIIGEEIKMYDDSAEWRVMFNLLETMYSKHPVRIDIAGTVESISHITPEKLYTCYNNFYNLNNMVLAVCGNVDIDTVVKIADKMLKPCEPMTVSAALPAEPAGISKDYIEQKFPVSMPMFELGCKEDVSNKRLSEKQLAATDVLMSIIASESTALYRKMIDAQLINNSFSFEHFEGPGFSSALFNGESRNPHAVSEMIKDEIKRLLNDGIDESEFEIIKKSIYGETIASFNNIEGIGSIVTTMHFANREVYTYIDELSKLTLNDIEQRLHEQFKLENFSLSVVMPK